MIIALIGQKGGSGKTTAAIALAAEWHRRGRRALLVDADPQQGSTRTWGEVAAEQGHAGPTVVAMGAGLHRPDQLPALARAYDVAVVDCPGRLDAVQRAALMVADVAVIPCGPSAVDAWAVAGSVDLVAESRSLRPDLQAAILITRRVARTVIGTGARETLAECGLPVLATELGYRVAFQEAPASGLGLADYAPGSAAALEVEALAGELEELHAVDLWAPPVLHPQVEEPHAIAVAP